MPVRIIGEVIKTYEIEVQTTLDNEPATLILKVELLRSSEQPGQVTARVWRREFFRLQPSFPQEGDSLKAQQCDEVLLVDDTAVFGCDSITSQSWETVLSELLYEIGKRFTAG